MTEPTRSESATFDDADEDRFSAWLKGRSEPRWTDATRHRFVEEYREGTLEDGTFRRYIADDYAFLEGDDRYIAFERTVDLEARFFDAAYDPR
ncbi:hypothetical protein ACFQGT_07760 [Natrialbaceae archaeon GCM10025810]|uniref:hypothetical protein n=1 Tax=Halovalidus salilacus TaxID=3075124 RepID=UPI00360B0EAD